MVSSDAESKSNGLVAQEESGENDFPKSSLMNEI